MPGAIYIVSLLCTAINVIQITYAFIFTANVFTFLMGDLEQQINRNKTLSLTASFQRHKYNSLSTNSV